MRVLALVTDAFGSYGGIARYNSDLINALGALENVREIRVLPRLAPRSVVAQHGKIRTLSPAMNKALYAARALSLALSWRPDIIYNGHLYHGPLAHRLASIAGAKLVSQLHGTEVWKPLPRRHLKPLEASDLVLCVSNDTKNRYLSQANLGTANADVLHNTVGEHFRPGDRASARAKFGLSEEFVILTVGRLDARDGGYKGHERIIRALPSLSGPRNRQVHYLIAGIGEDRARLKKIVEQVGVTSQVRFLGNVPASDLPKLYCAADLFALPSTGEGFGIVYLEAMACGTRALGLNVGGVPDALADMELGYCVSPEDFPQKLRELTRTETTTPSALSSQVTNSFGFEKFREQVRSKFLVL